MVLFVVFVALLVAALIVGWVATKKGMPDPQGRVNAAAETAMFCSIIVGLISVGGVIASGIAWWLA
ncbi:MAG: hypothetical protein Q7U97_11695 [Rhodocyclaceae bacterium]|nr:hypothetical protein [Rhodocyclaceae bacterium]